jgi:diketogulonate reductase-like aldo/keto reductase
LSSPPITQVALKWLVQHGAVACPGADTYAYQAEDAAIFGWPVAMSRERPHLSQRGLWLLKARWTGPP